MTKCIVLGEQPKEEKKRPIVFEFRIDQDLDKTSLTNKPSDWNVIELVCMNYRNSGFDQMFAHNGNRNDGTTLFGHWNDGVVE